MEHTELRLQNMGYGRVSCFDEIHKKHDHKHNEGLPTSNNYIITDKWREATSNILEEVASDSWQQVRVHGNHGNM
jgi:hypothetical protein